jgi:hypothetical protein
VSCRAKGPKSLLHTRCVSDTTEVYHETADATPNDGFVRLDEDACMALLESGGVGHLGFTSGALPVVAPVRYRLASRSLVFATERGPKLTSARRNSVACVEIAGTDASTGTDWSVLATGRLREITDPSFITVGDGVSIRPWCLPTAEYVVALDIELLSGVRSRVL